MTAGRNPVDVEHTILDLLALRGPGKTICPSEAARRLAGSHGFRPFMPLVREAARSLADAEKIEVLQRGQRVDLDTVRGPIRLRAVAERRGSGK